MEALPLTLRGIGADIVGEVQRIPDELSKSVDAFRQGTLRANIKLKVGAAPQFALCSRAIEEVRAHPEWLT